MNPWREVAQQGAQLLRACRLCPRDCGTDRTASAHGAFCRLDHRAWVYKELLSLGEEPSVSPTWLVDTGGCSLRCAFCSEWDHVVEPSRSPAVELGPAWFAATMARRRAAGARTVSFVGGDPTVSLPAIATALAACEDPLPVVWNCNALLGDAAWTLLAPRVATWTLDAKFGEPRCARTLGGVRGFDGLAAVDHTLDRVLGLPVASGGQQGVALPRLIVRHLLMPGHLACCTLPVLARLAGRLRNCDAAAVEVNLMTTYVPPMDAAKSAPSQWNSAAECDEAVRSAVRLLGPLLRVDGRLVSTGP